ncbi:hypothetical protein NA56DRAFT_645131 [Hyaloscypha hepaticicola]|uniref:Nephrocystin 3-like N-terminal domain-containing protein n=1 Tax=Hyaloscypha hepaticicola TaxID=2082293 RepID=A0A2J6Q6I2_9HELO|nr:hypothetical protein NA56DRAFT_645131 [Hyaloscypha hepaticicola]
MALPEGDLSHVTVHDIGLTVLRDPPNPIADIVFVHGLQGHPRKTWACQANADSSQEGSARRKSSPFRGLKALISRKNAVDSGSSSRSDGKIFWPIDLLPEDCPNVRLLTWGYESNISRFFGGPANQNTIFAHARDLLYALGNERQSCRMRSLIFIAHSLGGIIVKDVLRRADNEQDQALFDVFTSTRAILFLGTPHRGSSMAETGEMVRRLAGVSGFSTSDGNIRALHINSSELEVIHEGFMKLYQRNPRPFEVSTFKEAQGLSRVSYLGLGEKVVNDVSSSFTGTERCQTINANHREMCRFRTKHDDGYKKIVGELRIFLSAVEASTAKSKEDSAVRQPSPTVSSVYSLNDVERLCIQLFNTSDIGEYESNLPRYEKGTCQWVLSNPNYLYWYNMEKSCLLWISGHPGSGKTVLSAYLLEYLSANKPPFILRNTVCFFFCDDKVESQRDGRAILRSLIHQILIRRRKLIKHIKAAYDVQGPRLVDNFNELWRIFKAITTDSRAGSINIIVDAIDECEEKTRHRFLEGMAAFIAELQSNTQPAHPIKILITSRPLLNRRYRLGDVQIEDLDSNTVQDLQLFINRKINGIAHRTNCRPEARRYLEQALQSKADRTFLWVRLVLERLEKSPVATQKDFQRLVEELPKGLVATYERFLYDIPTEYQETAKQLLYFIAGSRRPLSLDEIRILLALQDPHKNLAAIAANSQPNIRETIETILGSFVRIMDDHVSLAHQSAKDFLHDLSRQLDHPLSTIYGISAAKSDELLAKSCISYLLLDDFSNDMFEEDDDVTETSPTSSNLKATDEEGLSSLWDGLDLAEDAIFKDPSEAEWVSCRSIAARNQLFDYAALHWVSHFQSCSTLCSIELQQLAVKLSDSSYAEYWNWFRYYWLHCEVDLVLPTNFTAFITGCFFGHLATVKIVAETKPFLDRDTISHGLYWASWKGHETVVSYLLHLGAMPTWKMVDRQTPLIVAARFDHLNVIKQFLQVNKVEVNDRGQGGRTALSVAAGNGHIAIVECLLHHEDIQPDTPDFSKWTPIFWALGGKYFDIVRMFALDNRTDLNHIDKAGRSILSWAAAAGETEMVKFLLYRKEVDVRQRDFRGRTALSWAAENGHLEIVSMLRRSNRISISEKDNEGRNAISWAAKNGHDTVMKYLMKYDPSGADEKDENGWTPLAWALDRDSPDTVKTLLESGLVDPNQEDKSGRTPLSWAKAYGYGEVIRLLADVTKSRREQKESLSNSVEADDDL